MYLNTIKPDIMYIATVISITRNVQGRYIFILQKTLFDTQKIEKINLISFTDNNCTEDSSDKKTQVYICFYDE